MRHTRVTPQRFTHGSEVDGHLQGDTQGEAIVKVEGGEVGGIKRGPFHIEVKLDTVLCSSKPSSSPLGGQGDLGDVKEHSVNRLDR